MWYGGGHIDRHGNPVKKTPFSHPYSYDCFVKQRFGPNEDIESSIYTDRMFQWDWDKMNKAQDVVRKRKGWKDCFNWSNLTKEDLDALIQYYWDNPNLEMVLFEECCNVSSGYPIWIVSFKDNSKKEEEK